MQAPQSLLACKEKERGNSMMVREKLEKKSGVHLHLVPGEKFKTATIGLLFRNELRRQDVTKTALLAKVLLQKSYSYPARIDWEKALEEWEGAVFDISIVKKGAEQILYFYMEVLQKPDRIEEAARFLWEMSMNPYLTAGGFDETVVKKEKEALRKEIESLKDDKKEYAKLRCVEETLKDSPCGICADGYAEDVMGITSKELYQHYKNVMAAAPIEVVYCGKKELANHIFPLWDNIPERKTENKKRHWPDRQGPVNEIKETMEVSQGKLCLAYTLPGSNVGSSFAAALLYNEGLGGGSNSKLFQSLREQEGLCYYIHSWINRFPMLLMVQAGIEEKNYQKAVKMIQEAVEERRNKGMEQAELEEGKRSLTRLFSAIEDDPGSSMDFALTEALLHSEDTVSTFLKELENVTAQEAQEVGKKIRLRTVYFMKGKENRDDCERE